MGVISFTRPQEGLEQFQKALGLMELIQEIVNNPQVGDTVKSLSQQLSAAQDLSESKKKAARDAEEIIAQSEEFLEEFSSKKSRHEQSVQVAKAEIEVAHRKLQAAQAAHEADKLTQLEINKKIEAEAEAKLSAAKKISEDALTKQTQLEKAQNELMVVQNAHKENVKNFEAAKKQAEAELATKKAEHEASIQQLAEQQAAFELRKKRFNDALKE